MKKITLFKFCIILVAYLLFLACNNKNQSVAQNIINVDLTNSDKTILFSEIFDSVRYVRLETTEDILIKKITSIQYAENRVYILDETSKTIFAFDAVSGKCLWKIRNLGQGPGEYTQLRDFDVDVKRNRLYLFGRSEKIQEYDLDGNFIGEYDTRRLTGNSVAVNGDYMYIYVGNNSSWINDQKELYYLLTYNKNEGFWKGQLPFEANLNQGLTRIYSPVINAFYHYNDEIRFFFPYSQNIYSIKGDEVKIAHQFDFGEYNLPKNLSAYSTFEELDAIPHVYGLNTAWENDRYLSVTMQKSPFMVQMLYSKREDQVKAGIFYDDIAFCTPRWLVQATNDFVLTYLPADLCFEISRAPQSKSSLIKRITNEIDEDDNPVLLFYHFKK